MDRAAFLRKLGIEHPIIQGPLGGGPSTPELVSAVSNAGGMGFLGAAYATPAQITADIHKIKSLTSRPFGVNLFTPVAPGKPVDPHAMLDVLTPIHAKLGIAAPAEPKAATDPLPGQLDAVLANQPAVFSFTFGIPEPEIIRRIKNAAITLIGTATTVEEARLLEKVGVDAITLQGEEAGAHRGTFARDFDASMVPIDELVRDAVKVVSVPVIASGGLMDGHDVARVLSLGAVAAQLGTAFIPTPECGASEAHKQAILSAADDRTIVTRAYSGRPARGIRNTFIDLLDGRDDIILPYPLQNALTRQMRAAAGKTGDAGYLSLWAGRGVTRARRMSASRLVDTLVDELNVALSK